MNKNPFLPQPSYTPQQPPLPPGPPPPQPAQPDYSAYWAAAAAHQQPPHPQPPPAAQYNPQWSAPQPQPPPRPPAEQSALYANYGYGNQQNWQRQQLQHQQLQHQHQYHPPSVPIVQAPPQPPAQPGYNPYQPTAGYPQQYLPQTIPAAPQPMAQPAYPHPQAQQAQQQYFPQHVQPQQQHQPQPQQSRHHIQHTPPHHLPPAKRQRFDGPNSNRHNQPQHHPPPPQPQFQAPPPPAQNMGPYAGLGRGGGPPGMNHMGGRGGLSGGRGGPIGVTRGARGSSMVGARGSMSGRGRGGGSSYMGGNGGGGRGGGGSGGPSRGHGSRGNFGKDFQHRRGGSFTSGGGGYGHQNSSFRNRGQAHGNRGGRHDGSGSATFVTKDGQMSSSFGSVGKKDENRRTLTDFKIVGLEIRELSWTWGNLPLEVPIKSEIKEEETFDISVNSQATVKEETMDDEALNPVTEDAPAQLEGTLNSENDVSTGDPPVVQEVVSTDTVAQPFAEVNAFTPPPSRIRIYFHTPVTADDSHPIPHNSSSFSFGVMPSDSRKGKRKKLEDDDGDLEEGRARFPPPPMGSGTSDDRSSVAASVAPSIAETASEADWLMAAIVEGEEEAEAESELHPAGEPEDGEGGDRLCVNQILEAHEHDGTADGDAETVTGDGSPAIVEGTHSDTDVEMWAMEGVVPMHQAEKHDGDVPVENRISVAPDELDAPTSDDASVEKTALDEHPDDVVDSAPSVVTQLDEVMLALDSNVSSAVAVSNSAPSMPSEPSFSDYVSSSQNDIPVSSAPVSVPDAFFALGYVPHHDLSAHSEEQSADHSGLPDVQVSDLLSHAGVAVKSLESVSAEATLLNVEAASPSEDGGATIVNGHNEDQDTHIQESQAQTQTGDMEATQVEFIEHPTSPPTSNKLLSTSSTSTFGESPPTGMTSPEVKAGRTPSANRLSISYAGGNRRMVVDAEVVESLKVFRQEGRIEVIMNIDRQGDDGLKGILLEGLSDATKSYLPLETLNEAPESDCTLPPFSKTTIPSSLTMLVHLDTARPLSEPKWAKSGDIQEWLKSMFGRMFWVAGEAAEGWEKKIQVVDPDPPPTIWTVLEGWATNSPVGNPNERQRFLKTHMTETDNILEILLRLVRGERATPSYQSGQAISAPNVSGPLLSALSPGSAHGAQQTHVSLAVLALFRMTVEYAKKAAPDTGKIAAEERVGEIIRCLPSHLVYKSLDGIFKEWRVDKKGR